MNTQLKKLFDTHWFSEKDRYEFLQIFNLLPDYKKSRVIENFDMITLSTRELQNELKLEQDILFGKALENIELRIAKNKKYSLAKHIHTELSNLRSTI